MQAVTTTTSNAQVTGFDMPNETSCPLCDSDLTGPEIPEEYLRAGYYGPWNGEKQYYSRLISVEVQGVYDGGLFNQCPDCGGKFHRWPENHPLRLKAESYVS